MNDEAPKPRRKWISILVGVLLVVFMLGIGAVVFSVAWFRENMQIATASEGEATSAFDEVHAKFAGRPPLLEYRDGAPHIVSERASEPASTKPMSTLHILAFDSDEGKMARFSLPFWLLRMKSGPIQFGSYASGFDDRVRLTIEDIEKHGPGIVIDLTHPREGRFLVWAE